MMLSSKFVETFLPYILAYFSETLSGNPSGSKAFEEELRKTPLRTDLWRKVFSLTLKIFENETMPDIENLSESEILIYKQKWDEFHSLLTEFEVYFESIFWQWLAIGGRIKHTDTGAPEEGVDRSIYYEFHRRFNDWDWAKKYKIEIKEMFQEFVIR